MQPLESQGTNDFCRLRLKAAESLQLMGVRGACFILLSEGCNTLTVSRDLLFCLMQTNWLQWALGAHVHFKFWVLRFRESQRRHLVLNVFVRKEFSNLFTICTSHISKILLPWREGKKLRWSGKVVISWAWSWIFCICFQNIKVPLLKLMQRSLCVCVCAVLKYNANVSH